MEVQHVIVKTRKHSSQDVTGRQNRTEILVAKTLQLLAERNTRQRVKAGCLQLEVNELMNRFYIPSIQELCGER